MPGRPFFADVVAKPLRRKRILQTLVAVRASTGLLVLAALLLIARRAGGALAIAPNWQTAALCSLAVVLLIAASRWAERAAFGDCDMELPGVFLLASALEPLVQTIAAAVIAAALSLPRCTTTTIAILWAPCVGLVGWGLVQRFRPIARDEAAVLGSSVAASESLAADASLILTRSVTTDGSDVCRGTARAEFVVGQRTAAIHLAFCPPFTKVPKLEVDVVDDSGATVKVGQALPYAARIDVKLPQPAAAKLNVAVQFTATCS